MKKFVVVSVFVAGIISTSFSQSRQSSISRMLTQMATSVQVDGKGTIKYANGDKYVGEYIKTKTHPTMKRMPHGKGVKTCMNGDRMDGEWRSNQFVYGIWQFANGDLFEGSCNNNYPQQGTYTFVAEGTLQINNMQWTYPANTQFRGDFALGVPESGEYNKPLISEEGHIYTGKLLKKEFDNGVMQFPNGDIFKGSFVRNKCYIGDYKYASDTTIKGDGYHWIIPAGCTFTGTVTTLTGCVDKIIRDNEGNQYLGNLKHGKPHGHGSMTYANRQVEKGEWVDGMSPTKYQEYLAEQEAERQRKEAEQKRKQELYDAKYQIEKIKLIDDYDANDDKSMADNNSSAFCYRVVDGTDVLSDHSYGMAVDINPLYNPYVRTEYGDRNILPVNATEYADRTKDFAHKIEKGDICYNAFIKRGFKWGGEWEGTVDYQHFYKES